MSLPETPKPVPVEVTGTPSVRVEAEPGMPLPVSVVSQVDTPRQTVTTASGSQAASPTTTEEQDRGTEGQRRVNILWEVTQAVIAVLVTIGTLIISSVLVLRGDGSSATAFLLLSNAFFMIVTAYFQRTNHTRVGGIPPTPQEHR